ncbi:MAG: metallophosphoesterase family protein [Gammaproteobacteria bacterium]
MGDIHGRLDLVREMVQIIAEDARGSKEGSRRLIFLGDYVSRGSDSRGVIDYLLELEIPGFETVFLKGNNEACLLRFAAGDLDVGALWLANGGLEVLRSYGVTVSSSARPDRRRLAALSEQFARRLPRAHLEFLRGLPLCDVLGDYYFVHAGIRPGVALDDQSEHDQLWIRDRFRESERDHGAVIVHGHVTVSEVEVRRNRIGIDTGAWKSGKLSCLVLEEDRLRFLHTG